MSQPDERNYDLSQAISQALEAFRQQIHVSMPGIIMDFDPASQTATVQPALPRVTREDGERVPVALPPLMKCPVKFQRAGGYSLTLPVKKGDECFIHFAERATDRWIRTGEVNMPWNIRQHDLTDAFVTMTPTSEPSALSDFNPDHAELRSDNGNAVVTLDDTGTITAKASVQVILDTPDTIAKGNLKVEGDTTLVGETLAKSKITGEKGFDVRGDSGGPAITSTGDTHITDGDTVITNGDVTADGVSLKQHTHTGDSGGTTSPPL